jgi:hypothetical protein
MSKHTPGPWEVRDRWYIHVAEPGTFSHAEVKCSPGIPSDLVEVHEANARLIAASPEMVELLREVFGYQWLPVNPAEEAKFLMWFAFVRALLSRIDGAAKV